MSTGAVRRPGPRGPAAAPPASCPAARASASGTSATTDCAAGDAPAATRISARGAPDGRDDDGQLDLLLGDEPARGGRVAGRASARSRRSCRRARAARAPRRRRSGRRRRRASWAASPRWRSWGRRAMPIGSSSRTRMRPSRQASRRSLVRIARMRRGLIGRPPRRRDVSRLRPVSSMKTSASVGSREWIERTRPAPMSSCSRAASRGSPSSRRTSAPSSSTTSTAGAPAPRLSLSARGVSSATILPVGQERDAPAQLVGLGHVVGREEDRRRRRSASAVTISRSSRADRGSRPRVGSSRNSTRGRLSSARASSRRWRMPVENVLTLRPATPLRRTCSSTSVGAALREAVERAEELEVLPGGRPLVDVRRLGDEVDPPADRLELARDVVAEHPRAPARRLRPAGEDADHRRLPGAVGAEQAEDLARRDLQADAVQRAHVAVALREVLDLDRDGCHLAQLAAARAEEAGHAARVDVDHCATWEGIFCVRRMSRS